MINLLIYYDVNSVESFCRNFIDPFFKENDDSPPDLGDV